MDGSATASRRVSGSNGRPEQTAEPVARIAFLLTVFFVAAAVALRKDFDGDERLDWLLLPGYFGFAFQYGFYTFLVATPVGLLFLRLSRRFAGRASRRR